MQQTINKNISLNQTMEYNALENYEQICQLDLMSN